jgi:hypothetical protein
LLPSLRSKGDMRLKNWPKPRHFVSPTSQLESFVLQSDSLFQQTLKNYSITVILSFLRSSFTPQIPLKSN